MNKVPDRANMRRKYVLKKVTSNLQMLAGIALLLICGIMALFFAGMLLVSTLIWITDLGLLWQLFKVQMLLSVGGFLFMCALSFTGHKTCVFAAKKSSSLTYVPPVPPVITLPAEEVLLRGSQTAPASLNDLLRPVAESRETRAEELLRASIGGKPE